MKFTKSTPRGQLTIQGESFQIPQPFAEGHTCTANEAAALNQVLAENVRNNNANSIKTAKEENTFDHSEAQAAIDTYVSEYEFGARRGGGGRSRDPVMARAMETARENVRAAIRAKGTIKLSDVPGAKITELAEKLISQEPARLESAKQALEVERAAAKSQDVDLSSLDLG